MTSHLDWGYRQHADVLSIQELDQILDQLTLLAHNKQPFSVDIILDAGESLSIVVGDTISLVNYYSPKGNPLIVGSLGDWDEEEGSHLFIFDARDSYSEVEKRFTVPIADAREAMRRFFATGQRPDNIKWDS